ncbi:MAG: peptidase C45 [Acidobacteria bacterium]|nr:peptidase C45 [Acidobacteriota bacterium]
MSLLSVRLLLIVSLALCAASPRPRDPRIGKGSRQPMNNGWIAVHLEGTPSEIGYQHGALLHHEIAELQKVIALELERDTKKDWDFYRKAAEEILWPKVDQEYREELQGIVEALNKRRIRLDIWDIVALNGFLELGPYYVPYFDKLHGEKNPKPPVPERCSAFIATGSYTKDGKIVLGHNAWTGYLNGQRWNIVFDVVPAKGNAFIMDGLPGVIHSGDDFAINAAGLAITETTISNFSGFDPEGTPEFVRARKAMQYAESIDEFSAIMIEGNNGGYANNWLIGDNKTGEIASLELGLKNVTLRRTTDGYFSGSNYPVNEKLIAEETAFPVHDKSVSANARRIRWDQLLTAHKGQIDVAAGQSFLSDSIDSFTGKDDPNERTLCGRIDLSPRGMTGWIPPYGIGGAVQNKVADSAMISAMSFYGAIGPQCGPPFSAREHLAKYPDNRWATQYLRDLPARPWTRFQAAARP